MSLVEYKETLNGPYLLPTGDMWVRYGIENYNITEGNKVYIDLLTVLKTLRPKYKHVIDGGSNLGLVCIPLAKVFPDLEIHAFEVQRLLYYSTCGTIALHGLTNCKSHLKGLSSVCGKLNIPIPDYTRQGNYGAFEVKQPFKNSDSGTWHWVNTEKTDTIDIVTIDSMELEPLLIKLDIEGMECYALQGASNTIDMYQPIVWCERHKSDSLMIEEFFKNKAYTIVYDKEDHWFFIPNWLKDNQDIKNILANQ